MWLDGSGFGTAVNWRDPEAPRTDTGDYVTYIYDDVGIHQDQPAFFWVRDKGDVPRSYICEISKSNSDKINSKERDFSEYNAFLCLKIYGSSQCFIKAESKLAFT